MMLPPGDQLNFAHEIITFQDRLRHGNQYFRSLGANTEGSLELELMSAGSA